MRALLYWITGFLPARYINHEGRPYLERYYVCTLFGRRYYLHRFLASDEDGVHNHPFLHSMSFILAGWYWEDLLKNDAVVRLRKRFFNYIGPNHFHRVVLPDNGRDVWTFFSHGPRVRTWGFRREVVPGDESSGFHFVNESKPEDPAFSNWHFTAPIGKLLRSKIREIPLGYSYEGYIRSGGDSEALLIANRSIEPNHSNKNG